MDECTLICETHGELVSAPYGPDDDPEHGGLVAGAGAMHRAAHPRCVTRVERETVESAEVWRELVSYTEEAAAIAAAEKMRARLLQQAESERARREQLNQQASD